MSSFKWCLLGAFFASSLVSMSEAAMVTYDGGGGDNRPLSITDLDVLGTLYDVTFDWGEGFDNKVNPVGSDLPDGNIDAAATAIFNLLDSLVVPNGSDPQPTPGSLQIGFLTNSFTGFDESSQYFVGAEVLWDGSIFNSWEVSTDDNGGPIFSDGSSAPALFSLAESSAVPEPSSLALLGFAVGTFFVVRRRRS